jgi:hypothetical protein
MTRLSILFLGAGVAAAVLGCSAPDLSSTNFTCTSDADCSADHFCGSVGGEPACTPRDTDPIKLGMSGPLQGPSQALGIEMRRGINAMLQSVNDAGGVHGRRVVLEALNDNYDPELALEMTRQLLDVQTVVDDPDQPDVRGQESVFALIGNIGTPTMLATAPVATKNQVVFFGPFTGAQAYLRDDTKSPYVYNYRAGYNDETEAMIDYISELRTPRVINDPATDYRRILVFNQNDSYGDAGYRGVVDAYNRLSPLPSEDAIARVGYEREDVASVDPAIAQAGAFLNGLLDDDTDSVESVAIIMIDTYLPGNHFIRGLKNWINEDATRAERLDVVFMNVSFVGGDSLAQALNTSPWDYEDVRAPGTRRSYAEDVIVTQVVPYYGSQARGVAEYRDAIRAYDDGTFTFTSLEGYVVARLFTTALEMNGPSLTTQSFVETLDARIRDLDIGIGTELNFTSSNHQACNTVWGSHIENDGSFSVPFVWNRDTGIQRN